MSIQQAKTEVPYYIGLDMGTNSVGWAVTDENYHILRGKGKDMWGVRLFEEAQTAAERRTNRVSRRRRQREVARIGVVKDYFADAIHEVDAGFFERLDESKCWLEDRSENNKQKFALFNDKTFTDKDYYAQYPTIFHLREELIESTEPHDVRLVYLAVLNLFKRRGHFLNKSLESEGATISMAEAYQTLLNEAQALDIHLPEQLDAKDLERVLSEKGVSRKIIEQNTIELMALGKKEAKEREVVKFICGLSGKVRTLYGEKMVDEEHKKLAFSFRNSDYEEKMIEVAEIVGDENMGLLEAIKEVHDIALLANILSGEKYLSMARVKQYEKHAEDLRQLKQVLKRYDMVAYREMFRVMGTDNYSAYVGSVNYNEHKERRNGGKGKDAEGFFKAVVKVLDALPNEAQKDQDVIEIREKISNEAFLPKQLTRDNGIIPNQVHLRELKKILENAATYLPFLNEVDESGLSVKERIAQLYAFQIPYYVGPLGQAHSGEKGYNVWAKRRAGEEEGRIFPWNFEQKINVEQAAEAFIARMVRHCTYLTDERTLPKQSLMYEKFMVLNELNNLRINGEKPSVAQKQQIYTDLFTGGKRVTQKALINYLKDAKGLVPKEGQPIVSGIDGDFKASLSSLGKFKTVLGDEALKDSNQEMMEQIIFWSTVYSDDKRLIRARIEKEYGHVLDARQIKQLLGMKFKDWGNLSKSFLELQGVSKEDGEYRSLLQALWETNDNLMELMGERYTYKEELDKLTNKAEKPLCEWTIDDLEGLYLSPSVKRMVWQTVKVLNEIVEVRGYAPAKIFVEMARDDAQTKAKNKGKCTQSRKDFLLECYKTDKEWRAEIASLDDGALRAKKLYLYYLQRGKCMYSGEHIDLETLMSGNTMYDIDHIHPQHYVKDDSLENNLVLVKKNINAHKSDTYPLEKEIRTKQFGYWKSLLDRGSINKIKFARLVRAEDFTPEELAGFINRQLVETRQGTKATGKILQQAFPEDNTDIIFTKAGVATKLRHDFDLVKVRCVNDTHHAHDAYLNIVAGNVYNAKFTKNPMNFIKKVERGDASYHMDKIFFRDVKRGDTLVWQAPNKEEKIVGTIGVVKTQLERRTVLQTCRSYMAHGILSDATIYSKNRATAEKYRPVKSSDERLADVTKYGGMTSIKSTAYALVEYTVKGKTIRSLEGVPIYLGECAQDDERLFNYLQETLQRDNKKKPVENLSVRMYPVRFRSYVKIDGYYYYLAGATGSSIELKDAVPLYMPEKIEKYTKKIEKAVDKQRYDEIDKNGVRIITSEKNQNVYNLLLARFEQGIFTNRFGLITDFLKEKRKQFAQLSIEEQCKILLTIYTWKASSKQCVDLTALGGSKQAGTLRFSKNLIGQRSSVKEALLIEQSATGLWSKTTDLLRV